MFYSLNLKESFLSFAVWHKIKLLCFPMKFADLKQQNRNLKLKSACLWWNILKSLYAFEKKKNEDFTT